jgi:exodeoxyribonuclease VIII
MGMHQSILSHPEASRALAQGESEMCMFANDLTGLSLKCRSDWISGNTVTDLKSTLDASKDAFAKTILFYGYDVQAAFNLDMSKWLGIPKDYFLFIAVEKEPPYAVAMYELDQESIEIGRNKYRRWISLVDHCIKTNEWPGYDPDITRISLPEWSKRQLALSYDVTHLPMLTE